MASSRFWSNALNIACTFVVAYSALALVVMHIHAHRMHHHHHEHPEGPMHHAHKFHQHFAWLSLFTGLTGIAAGCSLKRRLLVAFPIMLLVAELVILIHLSRSAVHRVHECALNAERIQVQTTLSRTDLAPGISLYRESIQVSDPVIDVTARDHCIDGVRHCVFLACLVIGAICTALTCCSGRLGSALAREARQRQEQVAVGEVIESRPLKQLDEDDDEEDSSAVPANIILIRRV